MRADRGFFTLLVATVLVASVAGSGSGGAAEFSARMIQTIGEDADTAKIFVRGSTYRVEQESDAISVVVIVDSDEGLTRVLVPDRRLYMELLSEDAWSLMNDPFQGLKRTESYGEAKHVGTESISGHECDKYGILMGGDEVMVKWVSAELDFPLKIASSHGDGRSIELNDIEKMPLDEALFVIPEGYSNQDLSRILVDRPDWADQVSSAQVIVPPFEAKLTAGELIRVEVQPGRDVDVSGRSLVSGNAAFTVVPLKDGLPIVDPSMGTMNLSGEGQGARFTRGETREEADEIVVRVREGEMMISVGTSEMSEQRLTAGEEMRVILEPAENIRTRFVNLHPGPSKCIWEFRYEGQPLSDDDMGPIEYRTAEMRNRNESESQTMRADADEMVVRAEEGEILVKIGQPEK